MTPLGHVRRVIAILVWMLLGFVAPITLSFAGLWFYVYGQRHFNWPPLLRFMPEWAAWAIFWAAFGFAPIALTVAALLLGRSGRLPGTRLHPRTQPGFEPLPVK